MSDSILYSEHDEKRTTNLFRIQVVFLKVFGLINPKFECFLPSKWAIYGKIASKAFNIFIVTLLLHMAILFAITTLGRLQYGVLEDITDALTMLVIYTFATIASIYWNFRSEALQNFFRNMSQGHEHHSLAGITFVNARQSYESARKLSTYWIFACTSGAVFWALAPLILGQRVLPVPCWYPIDSNAAGTYEVLYCIQFMAQLFMGATFGNGSALYVSAIIIMLGQFDVLCCSLKNVQAHAELLAGDGLGKLRDLSLDHDEVNQYITCREHKVNFNIYTIRTHQPSLKDLEQTLRYSMKRCILHHHFILRSCSELESLFSPYMLVKSLQVTMQLCLLVFIGVMGERTIVRGLNIVGYIALTGVELLMFTYFGELLKSHSLRFGEALLRSPWHKNTNLFKNEIFIFLVNAKRPIEITVGKFFPMDIERLRSLVAQAFSFLTLLQELADKKPR